MGWKGGGGELDGLEVRSRMDVTRVVGGTVRVGASHQ